MIHRVDIRSDIARFDGPIIDHSGRSTNLRHALFENRAAAYQAVQCGSDNLLGGKVLNKELQPGPNSVLWRQLSGELLGRIGELLHLGSVDSPEERLS